MDLNEIQIKDCRENMKYSNNTVLLIRATEEHVETVQIKAVINHISVLSNSRK